MMEVRRNKFNSPNNRVATPLVGTLQGVVVDNHSIAPESWIQPMEDKLGKRCYKPFLRPLDSHI